MVSGNFAYRSSLMLAVFSLCRSPAGPHSEFAAGFKLLSSTIVTSNAVLHKHGEWVRMHDEDERR